MIGRLRGVRAQPDDDVIHEKQVDPAMRWNDALVAFMRIASIVWIAKGVVSWAAIVGLAGPIPFEGAATGYQAAVIYFAVIDLVAAVGLWLASSWGGILWLLAVMSHLIIAIFFPRFVSNSTLVLALLILSTMIYLTISWLAAIEE